MSLKKALNISIFILIAQFAHSKDFPKEISQCHLSDEACIVKVTNEIINNHPNGYPEFNLDPVEPFHVDDIKLKGDPSKPVNFNLEMTNLSFTGYSSMTFEKISGFKEDPKDVDEFTSEAVNKRVVLKGKYKIFGKMLLLPITGDGDITIQIDGLRIKSRAKTKIEVKDEKLYVVFDSLKLKITAENMTLKLTNLFNGNKTLSDNMIKILNDNWIILWNEIEPLFSDQLAKVNKKKINKVLGSFPYKDLFLKDGDK